MAAKGASSAGIQYEELRPKSEWKEENAANILRIYLPEFKKEQLKITYVHSLRVLRITGERPITYGGNKWARFNQTFPVPPNCDVNNIQARFADAILTVSLPKSLKIEPIAPQEPKVSASQQEQPKLPSILESKLPPASSILPALAPMALQPSPKAASDRKDDRADVPKASTLQQKLSETKAEKGKEDPTSLRQVEERAENLKKMKEQEMEREKTKMQEEMRKRKDSLQENSSEDGLKSVKKMREPSSSDSVREALLEREMKATNDKEKFLSEKMKKVKQVAGTAKDAVKGFKFELTEDKQRIINIGVAVLVVAAVGAYMYCHYRAKI